MKLLTHKVLLGTVAALALGWVQVSSALIVEGANDSDGELIVSAGEERVIDLGEAVDAAWDTNNSGHAGQGVYDKDQWAVVFKYSSVVVEEGGTVTFTNHPSRAPVVWLVSGDVSINGTVSVNGAAGATPPGLAEPGPGGFRGGTGYYTPGVDASSGFGPGGAGFQDQQGYGGSYGSPGDAGPPIYGNPSLVPLLGGSGGGGDGDGAYGGGAGGGAMLVACAGTLTVNGSITANGGSRYPGSSRAHPGGGSGGGLRLVADTLAGSGVLSAVGGTTHQFHGGVGRIQVGYAFNQSKLQVTPQPGVVELNSGSSVLLWPPTDAPRAKIITIGGIAVGDDPLASFGTYGADAVIPETTTTQVVVETTNVEKESVVEVRVTPRTNTQHHVEVLVGPNDAVEVSTDPLVLHWTANIPVDVGYSALQAKVIRP